MQAGKLNQPLTIYRLIETKTPSGALIDALETLAATKGELISGSGSHSADNDRERGLNQYRFRIRWRPGVEFGGWVQWRGRWLKITAVDDADPHRRELFFDLEFAPKATPPNVI